MNEKTIESLAERAEREGDKALAVLLYVYLGAVKMGAENQLADCVKEFAKVSIAAINYDRWMSEG